MNAERLLRSLRNAHRRACHDGAVDGECLECSRFLLLDMALTEQAAAAETATLRALAAEARVRQARAEAWDEAGVERLTAALEAAVERGDAAARERDEWKNRRDRAVEECRLLHQEGMSRRDHHLKHCGAARAAEKAERERDEALAKVAAAEELAQEWKANDYRGWISSCGDDLLDTLRGAR